MTHRARRTVTLGAVALAAGALLVVQAPLASATGVPAPTCLGKKATIVGTAASDVLVGTFGKDVIASLAGNDVVRGDADFGVTPTGADDLICLGDGDDVADGAVGSDVIDGGTGNDRCFADATDVVAHCETVVRVPAGG